jgi:hypothetical protein
MARALFEQCGQQSWARFERLVALICPGDWSLSFVPDGQISQLTQATIVIPCAPIIASLRTALMVEYPDEPQAALRFPLAAVAVERRSAGGSNS